MQCQGTVLRVEEERVRVRTKLVDSCGDCGSCGACGGQDAERGILEISVPFAEGVAKGDAVILDVDLPNQALVGGIVFGIPLLLMLFGGAMGAYASTDDDSVMIFSGAGGLLVGFLLVAVINRLVSSLQAQGKIVDVVPAPEHENEGAEAGA